MKHLFSLLFVGLTVWGNSQTTFNVDMTCAPDFTEVFVTGPWCGWCANEGYNQAFDTDGDGIYTAEISELTGTVEYKYAINGFADQENLVNDMVDGATCAPITDFAGYANRTTPAESTTSDYYGTCDGTCNDAVIVNHPVTFNVDMSQYTGTYTTVNINGGFNGWCGGCATMTDEDEDSIYSITIDLAEGTHEYKFTVDGWNDQEMFAGGEACTSTIDGFTNRTIDVTAAATLDAVCWNSCEACVAEPQTVNVTFQVNMAETPANPVGVFMGGNFQSWNPGGTQLSDADGDGIYSVTVAVPANEAALYKFCNGPGWEYVETVPPSCGDGTGDSNRLVEVGTEDIVLDPVCFSGCTNCGLASATTALTLEVDMSQQEVSANGVHVAGSFQGWSPDATELTDEDGDGIYSVTLNVDPFTYEYKFLNGNAWGTDEAVPSACNVNGNRSIVVGDQDITVRYCFGQCSDVCQLPTPGADITFSVDVSNLDSVSSDGIYLMSSFTTPQWQEGAIAMSDDDGDGVWTTTVFVDGSAEIQFKYNNGNPWVDGAAVNDGEETHDFATDGCGAPNGVGGFNRTLVRTGEAQVLDVVCFDNCGTCPDLGSGTTFSVDMSCAPTFTEVFVTGPWCSWCANDGYNELTDADGDGIYEVTIYELTGTVEYKYAINGFEDQENLINDMVDGATCAPVTDYATYANRTTEAGSSNSDYYGTCDGVCNDVVDPVDSYSVTFEVDMSQYTGTYGTVNLNGSFNGWCGGCAVMTDEDADGVFEITIDLPQGTYEYKFTLDGWNAQEEFAGGEACTSTIDGFTNRSYEVLADGAIGVVCWNSCDACPDQSVGCTDQAAVNYNPNATADDGSCYYNPGCLDASAQNFDATADADDNSCQYLVTLRVNMSNETVAAAGVHVAGSFQGWDPAATPVPVLGYGVYEITLVLANGTYEYKFINGDAWGQDESVGECGNGGNRLLVVDGSDLTTEAACFNSCDACTGCTDPFSLEFDPFAGEDDGSCATAVVAGCTYETAENYMPSANVENGSCVFGTVNNCPGDLDGDGTVATPDLLSFLSVFGTNCD